MKTRMNSERERGQVALLIALAMVGLIGFAALAIDGGMLYSDRRMAQNAADAAAMAGALTRAQNKSTATIQANAMAQAAANGFDNNGTTNWVEVVYPYNGDNQLVQVKIKSNTDTSFIHLFYQGAAQNQVEAIGRAQSGGPIAMGNAIAAMNPTKCGAFSYKGGGNGGVDVHGGNIFSNSNCQPYDKSGNGAGYINVDSPYHINAVINYTSNAIESTFSPLPIQKVAQIGLPNVPEPDCDTIYKDQTSLMDPEDGGTLQPGKYEGGKLKGDIKMAPGLYCIYGEWTANGNGTLENEDLNNGGVMIYLANSNAALKFNGTFDLKLNSVDRKSGDHLKLKAIDGQIYDYAGFLIYQAVGNANDLIMLGNSNLEYRGTIYAPSAQCEIGGSTEDTGKLSSQIVCDAVLLHGTSATDVFYDGSGVWNQPPSIELYK